MQKLTLSTGWQVRPMLVDEDPPRNLYDWLPAAVPGTVHEALLAAGKIPDPFVDLNESAVQWVGESDWLYRCRFSVPEGMRKYAAIDLCCDGLDTFATVWLNGVQILTSDNMFLPQRVRIEPLLDNDENELLIRFDSAWWRGKQREAQYGKLNAWNTDPSRVYVRKAQYHYGWDWGPSLLTAGPWQAVRLEAYNARIIELHAPVLLTTDLSQANVPVTVQIERVAACDGLFLQLALYNPHGDLLDNVRLVAESNALQYTFQIPKPELWWPHGYGSQPLYRVVAEVLSPTAIVEEQRELQLGIRRLRLVQEPIADEAGTSFYFEVNNTPIFCGGANWIPADSFTPRIDAERYRSWLTTAVTANMHMIRVWGGGIYEPDCFYDLCDALGLLVWQDFMFGCGRYPASDWFQASVRAEAEAQVRRLRHHPCLVLWCGNNEDYLLAQSLKLYDHTSEPDAASSFPAREIYEQLLPEIVARVDGQTPYWPGSPFGGPMANVAHVGDRHVWDVWHGELAPYQEYAQFASRFVSEFGMGAFPARSTIARFAPPEQQLVGSAVLNSHHKAAEGNMRIAHYVATNLGVPATLDAYIYASQLVQAEALIAAYNGWRRCWGSETARATGGALVWQLNDCWPTISWALLDYYQQPKAAFFAVRRALAPLAVGLAARGTQIDVWAVSSMLAPCQAELELRLISLNGAELVCERQHVTLAANATTELGAWPAVLNNEQVLAARLFVAGDVVARAVVWPQPLKALHLPDPELRVERLDVETVRLSVKRPAKGVWLRPNEAVVWSDNLLDLVPGDPQTLRVVGLGTAEVQAHWLGKGA